jgi:hypothetical protein
VTVRRKVLRSVQSPEGILTSDSPEQEIPLRILLFEDLMIEELTDWVAQDLLWRIARHTKCRRFRQ